MPYSIADIAKRAGVSTTTVSRVINHISKGVGDATRDRVNQVIQELNYRPNLQARGMSKSHSGMIGVIIPDVAQFFYPQILRSIDERIRKKGYSMMLCSSGADPEREKQQLLRMVDHRVEGVILCSGTGNEAFLRTYRTYGVPFVLIGRMPDGSVADVCISGDNEGGMYKATSYLLSHGHKDIICLEGSRDFYGTCMRQNGFEKAVMEQAAKGTVRMGDFSVRFGFETMSDMLEHRHTFTAVVTGSDLIAVGAVRAMRQHNIRIPDDMEVIGFDNMELCQYFEPFLSSVDKSYERIATEAADGLMDIIERKPVQETHILMEAELVLRDTTRPDAY